MRRKVKLLFFDGDFIVGIDTGKERQGKGMFGVLKRFDNPVHALTYACGLLDGWQLATMSEGCSFVPVEDTDLRASSEFATATMDWALNEEPIQPPPRVIC